MKKAINLLEKYSSHFDKEQSYTKEERNAVLEAIRNFHVYDSVIRRGEDLKQTVQEIIDLTETVGDIMLKETEEWFDNVTVNRHLKEMKNAAGVLAKEAKEIYTRQQRLEAAYEDIAEKLGKYFDV